MTESQRAPSHIDILLVEDDPGDVILTRKTLESCDMVNTFSVAKDGVEALAFLRQEGEYAKSKRPDLILLDLNMPRMDGREFLSILKSDPELRRIPVVVLTTSDADKDVVRSYDLQASCFLNKPVGLGQFQNVVQSVQRFWVASVKYPSKQ